MANCNECWANGPSFETRKSTEYVLSPIANLILRSSKELLLLGESLDGLEPRIEAARGIVSLEKDCSDIGKACESINPNNSAMCPKIIHMLRLAEELDSNYVTQ